MTTELNGEEKQRGSTSLMLFDVPALIAYVTSFMTLLPGDVIATGTPAGVGPMQPGTRCLSPLRASELLTNRVVSRD